MNDCVLLPVCCFDVKVKYKKIIENDIDITLAYRSSLVFKLFLLIEKSS